MTRNKILCFCGDVFAAQPPRSNFIEQPGMVINQYEDVSPFGFLEYVAPARQ